MTNMTTGTGTGSACGQRILRPGGPQRGFAPATQRGCLGGCPERVPLLHERAVVAARGRAAIPLLRQPPVGMTGCAVCGILNLWQCWSRLVGHCKRSASRRRNRYRVRLREPVRRPEAMSTSYRSSFVTCVPQDSSLARRQLTSLRMTPSAIGRCSAVLQRSPDGEALS